MIIINPESGAVSDTTEENAAKNIQAFINDLNITKDGANVIGYSRNADKDYGDGRYCFDLNISDNPEEQGIVCEIQMPGNELEKVRFMDRDDQNIWNFPRLYVDGSSWVWCYAINCASRTLKGEDDE